MGVVDCNVTLSRWSYFSQNSFHECFHLGWSTETFLWAIEGSKQQPFCSSHTLSFICWLTLLVWGSSQAYSCPIFPWMLLQDLLLLGQVCVFSSVMKGPAFCRTPIPSRSEATGTAVASFHPWGLQLVLALSQFTSSLFFQLPTTD